MTSLVDWRHARKREVGGGDREQVRQGGRQGVRGENDTRHDQRLEKTYTTKKKERQERVGTRGKN